MMQYKGYVGQLEVDDDAGVLRGKVVNTKDTITFQGQTVEEARSAFRASVDDYVEFCASLGEPPEKPYSGRFIVRVKPEVHQALSIEAHRKGVSFNRLVSRQLGKMAERTLGSLQSTSHEKSGVSGAKAPKTAASKAVKGPKASSQSVAPSQAGVQRGVASPGKAKPKASK